ncbi:MAG: DUF5060 domain-containing protein [Anaerolineaceae bacterium]|nr:DUF5060 domain-containing protein [Anaerolineaceae bacterium]
MRQRARFWLVVIGLLLTAACGGEETVTEATAVPTPQPTAENLPEITAVTLDRPELPRYESLEMAVELTADYCNPIDAREVQLNGTFTAPDGTSMVVPGFWDSEAGWLVRFTPSQEGEWHYALTVQDNHGQSQAATGSFAVTSSDRHGWLLPGNAVNPAYSGHYLVHHDGTPFYGVGHCEALNILIDGFDVEDGVRLFDRMQEANENFVVWWPLYTNSPVGSSYDRYTQSNLDLIDLVVADAQSEGIFLIFTIWDHPELRDDSHAWDTGRWTSNGFKNLGSLESFFVSDEAWAWQENFYRTIIARWGYSPAIGMWQTVSEINGTNAYDQTDAWHSRVNDYFVANDPYRHPTTASMAGDIDWEAGHLAMDAPQVHVYALNDAVKAADTIAGWTATMFNRAEKPNWIGEFGVGGDQLYPELFHNSIWAALAAGAAMTPAEWNSGGFWGRPTEAMNDDLRRLADFVADLPLAQWRPEALAIHSSEPTVRGWGVAGEMGGLFWVQDFSMEGQPLAEVRSADLSHDEVVVEIEGLAPGSYTVRPYDTWQGVTLDDITLTCAADEPCRLALPPFTADMAFKIMH